MPNFERAGLFNYLVNAELTSKTHIEEEFNEEPK
jgi:hypothetical protein